MRIGYQNGIEAARQRMKKLDPGGFNATGTGAWDKYFATVRTLVYDHDAAIAPSIPSPPPPPIEPNKYAKVAPRVAYLEGGSDARYCTVGQPGVTVHGDGSATDDVANYDKNGLCTDGKRSDGPAMTGARGIDGRDYCSLPVFGDPKLNTGSWYI
jgi:hypothetical protein